MDTSRGRLSGDARCKGSARFDGPQRERRSCARLSKVSEKTLGLNGDGARAVGDRNADKVIVVRATITTQIAQLFGMIRAPVFRRKRTTNKD